jgi:hypothetical protein
MSHTASDLAVARLMHFTSQKVKPVFADLSQILHRPNPAATSLLRAHAYARRWGSSLSRWIVVHRGHGKRSHGRLVTGNESKEVRCSVMEVLILNPKFIALG